MDALVKDALVTEGTPQVFLNNKLVVILPANNPSELAKLEDLANSGSSLCWLPKKCRSGSMHVRRLDQMNSQFGADFKDKVLAHVVSNEDNVKQVVAKVQLGEADAGIVYTSDAVRGARAEDH